MIESITAGLADGATQAKVSPKCGLHVHVDAGDMNVWDVRRFVKLYAALEEAVFRLTENNPQRRDDYCRPCGDKLTQMFNSPIKDLKHHIAKTTYFPIGRRVEGVTTQAIRRNQGKVIRDEMANKYHGTRYSAMNLHSYWFRGTIEFRHHHGTIDRETITHYGIAVGSLVDWAANHTDAQLTQMLRDTNRHRVFMKIVAQPATVAWMKKTWDLFKPQWLEVEL